MKKIVAAILILSLAACVNKETQPDLTDELSERTDASIVEEYRPPVNNSNVSVRRTISSDASVAEEPRRYITNPLVLIKDVQASSELPGYSAGNLIDYTWQSWASDNGIEESFTFYLNGEKTTYGFVRNGRTIYPRFSLYDKKTITGFALKNGHGHLDYYSQNNRVKSFEIYADDEYIETINIKDSISFEQYTFENPVTCETIRFVIDDVYPGTRTNTVFIAEIALLEREIEDRDFYERILFWLGDKSEYYESPFALPTQYENHIRQMAYVSDVDKILLGDYLPFDVSFKSSVSAYEYKTQIALLDGQSSLKLTDNLPYLDGATAMYPLYSSFVHAVYPEVKISADENSSDRDFEKWEYLPNYGLTFERSGWYDLGEHRSINSVVQCNTTSEAYRCLIIGAADIVFCYEPSQAEINEAARSGITFNLTPIAKDAFVFIVNENNILNNITQKQIRDIYSGRITNWKDISGVDEPVIAYQRPENSGSQTILQSIMREDTLIRPILDGEGIRDGMFWMIQTVASKYYNYNSAIGYSFLYYLTQMAGDSGTKTLAVDGVMPARQTIQDNTYPFVQTVYAITAGNESENTKRFIEWILSDQGQELVEKTGYIPVR